MSLKSGQQSTKGFNSKEQESSPPTKMITEHNVEGFDDLITLLGKLDKKSQIVLYFCGKVDENGVNWCPDCQVAEPLVNEIVRAQSQRSFHFVHVTVGTREEWKSPTCKFRTDARFKLTSVPTLMVYNTVLRLNDVECQDKENIEMLLEGM